MVKRSRWARYVVVLGATLFVGGLAWVALWNYFRRAYPEEIKYEFHLPWLARLTVFFGSGLLLLVVVQTAVRLSRVHKRATVIGGVIPLVGTFAGYLILNWPQREMKRLVIQVASVEVGKTKLDDWHRELEQARVRNWNVSCNHQQTCSIEWQGENKILHSLRLAPSSRVMAVVNFKDGVASEINVWMEIDDAPDVMGVAYPGTGAAVHQAADNRFCNQHYSTYVKQHGPHCWRVVTMDSCVLAEEHAKAFAINSHCLETIGGCKTPEEILPEVLNSSDPCAQFGK